MYVNMNVCMYIFRFDCRPDCKNWSYVVCMYSVLTTKTSMYLCMYVCMAESLGGRGCDRSLQVGGGRNFPGRRNISPSSRGPHQVSRWVTWMCICVWVYNMHLCMYVCMYLICILRIRILLRGVTSSHAYACISAIVRIYSYLLVLFLLRWHNLLSTNWNKYFIILA